MSYSPRRMKDDDSYRVGGEYRSRSNNWQGSTKKKSKSNKPQPTKFNIILRIIAIIYVIVTIIFYSSILRMGLLPNGYIVIFTIAEIIFTGLMAIGLAKTHKSYVLNVVCLVIVLLVSGVYMYISNYANATTDFLGSMFQEVQETEEYYVVVRNDSEYDEIEDITGEDVYSFQIQDEVKEKINSGVEVTFEESNNLFELGENLLNGDIDIILISFSQYSMLTEENENFQDDTKIIYTSNHEIEKAAEISTPDSKYTIGNGVFNVYISGIDTSGNINNVSRSDANILATINTNTREVLLTSIPRDYYVTLHSKGAKDKLTHSGLYGINETVTTVEDLLDVDINYYIRVNFTTVIELVDTLGGVEVYSEYDFSAQGYHFNQGYNYLNGAQALAFSRERHSFASGDNQRVKNQQAVIEAIIRKVLNSTTLLTRYTSILQSLEGSFQTNIDIVEIQSLVQEQLSDMSSWTIKNNALTGTGAYSSTYSLGSQQSYVMIPNNASVEDAKEQIDEVMGE